LGHDQRPAYKQKQEDQQTKANQLNKPSYKQHPNWYLCIGRLFLDYLPSKRCQVAVTIASPVVDKLRFIDRVIREQQA
jgi:hypothetical protein